MDMIPVSSSRIHSVGWQDNTMYARFHDGSTYAYDNVSQAEYRYFLNSPSLGSELSRFDKIHPYRRV